MLTAFTLSSTFLSPLSGSTVAEFLVKCHELELTCGFILEDGIGSDGMTSHVQSETLDFVTRALVSIFHSCPYLHFFQISSSMDPTAVLDLDRMFGTSADHRNLRLNEVGNPVASVSSCYPGKRLGAPYIPDLEILMRGYHDSSRTLHLGSWYTEFEAQLKRRKKKVKRNSSETKARFVLGINTLEMVGLVKPVGKSHTSMQKAIFL